MLMPSRSRWLMGSSYEEIMDEITRQIQGVQENAETLHSTLRELQRALEGQPERMQTIDETQFQQDVAVPVEDAT
jgi:prefoldin subunit 5